MIVPQVQLQAQQSSQYAAGRVVPMQDFTGQQIEQAGQGVQQLGNAMSRIGEIQQDQFDQARTKEVDALYSEAVRKTLADPSNGYLYRLGKDAVDGRESAIRSLDEQRKAVERYLTNDAQRAAFQDVANRRMQAALSVIDEHSGKQLRVYQGGETKARLESSKADYVTFQGQPEMAQTAYNTAIAEAHSLADQLGLPQDSEQRKALVLRETTEMHSQVLGKLVDQQPEMARAYLERFGGEMDVESRAKAGDQIGRATVRDESKKVADFVTSKTLDPVQQRQILDTLSQQGLRTEVFDAALQRLRSDDDERYQQQQRGARESVQQATTWLQQNRATAKTWNDLPASMQQSLVATGRDRDVQLFMEQGGQWVTTMQGRSALLQIAANPARLRGTNFDEVANNLRPHLDDAGMQDLAEAWKDANEPGKRQKLPESMVNSMIRLHAIDSGWVPGDDTLTPEQSVQLERYELAIKTRLMGMDVSDPSVVKQALADEDKHAASSLGKLPIAAASMAQKNGMFWDTPYGRADANRLTPEVKQPILRRLSEKNAEKARLYQSLPPDQRPSLEVTEADIALEFARDQWMQRERNAAADEAGRAAMRERRVTPDGQVYFVDPGWWSGSRSLRRAQYEKGRQDYLNRNSK